MDLSHKKINQSKRDSVGKSHEKKKKGSGCKRVEEVGIPTVFTPVPSVESCLAVEQTRLRRLREMPAPSSRATSELPSEKDPIPSEIINTGVNSYQLSDSRDMTRLVLIKVHLMQSLFTSFELGTDRTLLVLLHYVLTGISKEIRNKFSFYVFASAYEIVWNRPRCELMKRPPSSNIFRCILTPSQMNMTLSDLLSGVKLDGLETMNVYIFIKDMEDKFTGNESQSNDKSWKFHQIIN